MPSTVIIGSGLAGYSVARELRRRNKIDSIVVATSDDGHFYSKPALSEAHRLGADVPQLISRSADKMAQQFKGQVLTGTRVRHIDRSAGRVMTDRGTLAYDRLVLALGAQPGRLPLDAESLSHVLTVNDLNDYSRFRDAVQGKKTIVIIGAGLIGCEFANDLAGAGYQVKVVDIADRPLTRLLPDLNAQYTFDALHKIGVQWHLGTHVTRIERKGAGVSVHCASGAALDADVVLSATGLRPRTDLALEAGLHVSHGIVVDAALRTSDPNIYALGDCAEINGLWLPYIAPIVPAAKVIAGCIAGQNSVVRYPSMPISIKTPACPTIVCPPLQGLQGRWHSEVDSDGMQSLFRDHEGRMQGFALSGGVTRTAAELAQTMPALLH